MIPSRMFAVIQRDDVSDLGFADPKSPGHVYCLWPTPEIAENWRKERIGGGSMEIREVVSSNLTAPYRDRMFCSRHECRNVQCDLNATPEIQTRAARIGLTICLMDLKHDYCGYDPPCLQCGSELGAACRCHEEPQPI